MSYDDFLSLYVNDPLLQGAFANPYPPFAAWSPYQLADENGPVGSPSLATMMLLPEPADNLPTLPFWPAEWNTWATSAADISQFGGAPFQFDGKPGGKMQLVGDPFELVVGASDFLAGPQGFGLWHRTKTPPVPSCDDVVACYPEEMYLLFVPDTASQTSGTVFVLLEKVGLSFPPSVMAPVFSTFPTHPELVEPPPPTDSNNALGGILPFGWVMPGGHVLPSMTHPMVLVEKVHPPGILAPSWAPVFAPGDLVVHLVHWTILEGKYGKYVDVSIYAGASWQYELIFMHLRGLEGSLAEVFPLPDLTNEQEYEKAQVGDQWVSYQTVFLEAGEMLGFGGGPSGELFPALSSSPEASQANQRAIDMSGVDYSGKKQQKPFVCPECYPERFYFASSPMRYFTSDVQKELWQLLLSGWKGYSREWWGTHRYDMPGTLTGNWFRCGTNAQNAMIGSWRRLSFCPDFYDRNRWLVSIGDHAVGPPGVEDPELPESMSTSRVFRVFPVGSGGLPDENEWDSPAIAGGFFYRMLEGRCPMDSDKSAEMALMFVAFLSAGTIRLQCFWPQLGIPSGFVENESDSWDPQWCSAPTLYYRMADQPCDDG